MLRLSMSILVGVSLMVSPSFAAGIQNGDFEGGNLNNWTPDGAPRAKEPGEDSKFSAQLGPSPGRQFGNNLRQTSLAQDFVCGTCTETDQCSIRFAYLFKPSTEVAEASLSVETPPGADRKKFVLAASDEFKEVQAVFPKCGNLRIIFTIFEAGKSVKSEFRIDNVEDRCSSSSWPGVPPLKEDSAISLLEIPTLSPMGAIALSVMIAWLGLSLVARRTL